MTGTRIGALDGLRAVAVLAVLAFHLAPDLLPGGYLGVDLFMVLSGFLITGLLLDERARSGGIRLGAFWVRRFRRLVPALLLLVTVVATWVALDGPRDAAAGVRRQGLAALAYVANWRLVADGTTYASLQDGPSPLQHLWSLAVEEQFYVAWPLLVVGAMVLGRGRLRTVAVVAAGGAFVSAALMAAWHDPDTDPLRLYFGTDTRAHTFLVGAVAAVGVRRWQPGDEPRWVAPAGAAALGAVAAAFVLGEEGAWAYRGGFAAFAAAAAVAVVATTRPGPATGVLDRPTLRLVGRTSYGIYLWHWPIVVLIDEARTGLDGPALLALRLGLTAAATALSWNLVERPVRHVRPRRLVVVGVAGAAAAAFAVVSLPSTAVLAHADVDVARPAAPAVVPPEPATAPSATASAGAPGTVLILGDSGMYDAAPAIAAGLAAAGGTVVDASFPGTGLTHPDDVQRRFADLVAAHRPDLVVVMLGGWDSAFITERGDDAYRDVVDGTADLLTSGGAEVLWLAPLPGGEPIDGDPARFYAGLPARHPGAVDHLDAAPALADPEGGYPRAVGDRLLRKPDGWHLCPDGAAALATAVLDHVGVVATGWIGGSWRGDVRYDDPPGGCDA